MPRHDRAHGVHHSTRQKGKPGKKKGAVAPAGGSTHRDRYASKPRQAMPKLGGGDTDAA